MPTENAPKKQRYVLRFSLRMLLLVVTACCVAAWYWQRPYEVESTHKMFTGFVDPSQVPPQPIYEEGRKTETYRRVPFGDPVKHGPTRLYNVEGKMFYEEHWRDGLRHGLSRRWDETGAELQVEMEFERGTLVRFGGQPVRDFTADLQIEEGNRIAVELQRVANFDYFMVPLQDVVDDIAFNHNIPVVLNRRILKEAGIDPATPLSSTLHGVPLFAALCGALAPHDLTCAYQYEVLWITKLNDKSLNESRISLDHAAPELKDILTRKARVEYSDAELNAVFNDISDKYKIAIDNSAGTNTRMTLYRKGLSLESTLGCILYEADLYCDADGNALLIRSER